jgi:hypothetical protein
MPETRTFASEQVDCFSAKAQALIGINWQPDEATPWHAPQPGS